MLRSPFRSPVFRPQPFTQSPAFAAPAFVPLSSVPIARPNASSGPSASKHPNREILSECIESYATDRSNLTGLHLIFRLCKHQPDYKRASYLISVRFYGTVPALGSACSVGRIDISSFRRCLIFPTPGNMPPPFRALFILSLFILSLLFSWFCFS